MELSQIPVSDRNVKILQLMFGVNEQWLRTGEGEMFLDRKGQLLYTLETQWGLSTSEARLLVNCIAAPSAQRRKFFDALDVLVKWRQ